MSPRRAALLAALWCAGAPVSAQREPGDVARARAILPPAGIFAWP